MKRLLYHGSRVSGLRRLDPARWGRGVVGCGEPNVLWLTSCPQNATFYTDPFCVESVPVRLNPADVLYYGEQPVFALLQTEDDGEDTVTVEFGGFVDAAAAREAVGQAVERNNALLAEGRSGVLRQVDPEQMVYRVEAEFAVLQQVETLAALRQVVASWKHQPPRAGAAVWASDVVDGSHPSDIYAVYGAAGLTILGELEAAPEAARAA